MQAGDSGCHLAGTNESGAGFVYEVWMVEGFRDSDQAAGLRREAIGISAGPAGSLDRLEFRQSSVHEVLLGEPTRLAGRRDSVEILS